MKLDRFMEMVREITFLAKHGWRIVKIEATLYKQGQHIKLTEKGDD